MRLGTRTALGRKWTPTGVRPTGRQQIGYEYLYLYVAVKPFTGELFALLLPRLDKECFAIFARERQQALRRKTLMIADGAGAHRLAAGSERLELARLPAYAPELNPVERLFQELRRKLKFRVFDCLAQAERFITEALTEFFNDPERVKSITLFPYIKCARSDLN